MITYMVVIAGSIFETGNSYLCQEYMNHINTLIAIQSTHTFTTSVCLSQIISKPIKDSDMHDNSPAYSLHSTKCTTNYTTLVFNTRTNIIVHSFTFANCSFIRGSDTIL